jgi:shikimate dehydrogenase
MRGVPVSTFVKAAVLGHPVGHSKSPLIHNYWIRHHGLSGRYDAQDIAPDYLAEEIDTLVAGGYGGFNVTVPHKETVMALCDEIDPLAASVGAVNTLVVRRGRLYGLNTDVFGFTENIRASAPVLIFRARPPSFWARAARRAPLSPVFARPARPMLFW